MDSRWCLSSFLLVELLTRVGVAGFQMSITPDVIIDSVTSSLTVRCDMTGTPPGRRVNYMGIRTSSRRLVYMDAYRTTVDPAVQSRGTVNGTLAPFARAHLALALRTAVSCADAIEYFCFVNLRQASGSHWGGERSRTPRAISYPGHLQITARTTKLLYSVNDTVELECSGEVGKPAVGNWTWETRDATVPGSSWTPVPDSVLQTDEASVPSTSNPCQMTGRSRLRWQAQKEDDDRTYRCSFGNDSPSSYANFTFQVAIPANCEKNRFDNMY